ncbi:glycosyltransferase family 1 protein [Alpinimonas psychrophila]|uniref:D-inositol 3-phosphate glycosyltransferase n=1 Tax=Alpinimonas psychrophila TaxID=748908 RepID=A0A7W3PP21_9MICO|nr:glycosyltransferase family 1 protein [Alpinimonas psychrophila]MBA8828826.1 phosphatidylinositol alpha 1,6-mannosyltransferase [Alpinimonas psychrophila]
MGMRVAIVTESFLPSLNGVTNSVLRVLDTLAAEGHDAIVIAPTAPSGRHNGFRVIRTPAIPFMQFPVGIPNLSLQATLAEYKPDVIHVASPFLLGGQAIAAANRLGIPTVAIYQTDIAGYLQRYGMQFARPLVDKMVAAIHSPATLNLAPTPESAAYLVKLGVPRVAIWGRGVDLDLFHPHRRAARLSKIGISVGQRAPGSITSAEPLTIGFVGRLAPEKQVHKMKTLFGIPNTRFIVVGDGPERRRLEADFAGHPVTFMGALRGNDLAEAYASLDVFVHFGTEETFGQTIQEAQATGLPVVAPASGGPRFLIEHGTSGYLADPGDPASFVNYVTRLAEDAPLRSRMGVSARRSVLNKSWEANNALLLEHLSHACRFTSLRT